jgi:4-hydroxythreonine-4-phosphate dehydrogenase
MNTAKKNITVAMTPGCAAGVGPELWAHAIRDAKLDPSIRLVFTGSPALLNEGARRANIPADLNGDRVVFYSQSGERAVRCLLDDAEDRAVGVNPGVPNDNAIVAQRRALLEAVDLAAMGAAHAIVTGPVRKSALSEVRGQSFVGQTELFSHFLGDDHGDPLMCFTGADFVLGLATAHLALRYVPDAITADLLEHKIERLVDATARLTGKAKRDLTILLLGINPHAGEDGLLGHEEKDAVAEAKKRLGAALYAIKGPAAADGFFARVVTKEAEKRLPDAVLAMHHDQGLGPYKILAKGGGVNVTWGLKVPRTSPDHGTGDAVAGKGIADASSMVAALELGARLALPQSAKPTLSEPVMDMGPSVFNTETLPIVNEGDD